MKGNRLSTELKCFFKPNPDFIIIGILRKLIIESKGNTCRSTPDSIAQYETNGKIQNNFTAFSFPATITSVFLPLDLSAS
jgi:hypothetical protein